MNPLQIGKPDNISFFSVFILFPTSIISVSIVLFTPSLKSHSSLSQPTHHYPVSRSPLKPHLLHYPWRYTRFSSFINLATALALPNLYLPSLYTNKWICFCQQFIRLYKLKSLFLSSLIASFPTSSLTLLTIYSAMPISIITANEVLHDLQSQLLLLIALIVWALVLSLTPDACSPVLTSVLNKIRSRKPCISNSLSLSIPCATSQIWGLTVSHSNCYRNEISLHLKIFLTWDSNTYFINDDYLYFSNNHFSFFPLSHDNGRKVKTLKGKWQNPWLTRV